MSPLSTTMTLALAVEDALVGRIFVSTDLPRSLL
jgi:hypothetical protein